jgi:hypothetical protein
LSEDQSFTKEQVRSLRDLLLRFREASDAARTPDRKVLTARQALGLIAYYEAEIAQLESVNKRLRRRVAKIRARYDPEFKKNLDLSRLERQFKSNNIS